MSVVEQQAIVQSGNGGPEVLALETVPVLSAEPDQVLIRVNAAAVNPIDWKIREGYMPFPTHERRIPGFDVAGEVIHVGADVTNVAVGDAVFAMIGMLRTNGLNGGYSQYAIAAAANTLLKPQKFSLAEAATLGTAGLAAARMFHVGGVASGKRVFINGISGSVGTILGQLALSVGAEVIGTASAKHHDYLTSIGFENLIDYGTTEFVDVVDAVDVYAEAVDKERASASLRIVKPGGSVVSVVGPIDEDASAAAGVNANAIMGPPGQGEKTESEYLQQVQALAEAGGITVRIDTEMPLSAAPEAQELVRTGQSAGKVILRPF